MPWRLHWTKVHTDNRSVQTGAVAARDRRAIGRYNNGHPESVLPATGHTAQNARNNYERYTTMAKDAARRGDVVEAENLYQHAEHYFRVMREQGS